MVEPGVIGVAEQRHRLLLGGAEMDRAEGADAFAESELAARLRRYLAIKSAQAMEIGWVGNEDPRNDPRPRSRPDRVLADRERLENGRMRILVRLRHDADLANDALVVNLAGGAISARPFGDRPAPNALLIGERHLVIFAVVLPGLLGPGLLDDLRESPRRHGGCDCRSPSRPLAHR